MAPVRPRPPSNLNHLIRLIDELAREKGRPTKRIQRVVANVIISQLLPEGVVKGGTAMKLRAGEEHSRFTPDLDAARSSKIAQEEYIDKLAESLSTGWGEFTGRIIQQASPQPDQVPEDYIMTPFDIKLLYKQKSWLTVRFELGRDEVGSTEAPEFRMAEDIIDIFATLGLPEPQPVPVLGLDYQIAQKLHACTSINPKTGGNERAHDLVDLQIIKDEEPVDFRATAITARRLFKSRRQHQWPPLVKQYSDWDTIYLEAADGLDVIPQVDEAVRWANEFIKEIEDAVE